MKVNYAIVFVSDMKAAVKFYREVLGLPLRFESPGWSEFATEGATLALHAGGPSATREDDPRHPRAGQCRPGLQVPNLDAFHAQLLANGVTCIQEPKETFGSRTAQYADPDGLVISVSEQKGVK